MNRPPEIVVSYCGGCNPTYDRVAVVKELKAAFPLLSFVSIYTASAPSAKLIVNGCMRSCVKPDFGESNTKSICINSIADIEKSRLCLDTLNR